MAFIHKDIIISLTHNDLDALGCSICIKEKFNHLGEIITYSCNYRNTEALCHEIEDRIRAQRESVKILFITDISFSNNKNELYALKETCREFHIPVIFIDHHMYPDGFFDDLHSQDFKVFWDVSKSGSLGTYDALKLDNTNLKKIITIIDTFDLWKEERGELFVFAQKLNDYFMGRGKLALIDYFYDSKYTLPNDFKEVTDLIQSQGEEYYNRIHEKKLIFSPSPGVVFGFVDDFFNLCVDKTLKSGAKVFVIASSFGVLRVRFLKEIMGGYPDESIQRMKNKILDGEIVGHLHSFSCNLDVSSTPKVMERFKQISAIITEEIEALSA